MSNGFDGQKYEKSSSHQKEWGERLIKEIDLKGTEHILDLGCGNGLITKALAERVPEGSVVGVDSSSSMLERARFHQLDNMEFRLLDISDIIFDREFDIVFSNAAMHWVRDHGNVLRKIYASLKSGGIMRMQFAGEGNCPTLSKVLEESMSSAAFEQLFQDFEWPWYMPDANSYEDMLSSAGFMKYRVWMEDADRNFQDDQSFVGWIEQPSLVPFMNALPEESYALFRDTVIEKTKAAALQADGTYFEAFRRINVFAVKE
ncbi:methyltransferase domain-containing protein [Methanolobus sp. ZRKC2]|uniref:class I SAM-dependent methyltransferase n=1 Tax=Methanolobus sp. ZRKC2 TaxID=3125783 RepID=UPI003252D12B